MKEVTLVLLHKDSEPLDRFLEVILGRTEPRNHRLKNRCHAGQNVCYHIPTIFCDILLWMSEVVVERLCDALVLVAFALGVLPRKNNVGVCCLQQT